MSILQIRKAVRTGSKVVIGIAGPSGSGKTYTALKLARGMVSHAGEIGFLDTENKRGSLYADILDGQFLIGDLYPPFSPSRYSQAIKEFQAAGVKVLVIDSVSHEWEGEGGCEDIANSTNGRMANWKLAKSEHKKFMNALLQSDMHVIACLRAREKTDFTNPKEPKSLGLQPICEKNFMFEMTASMMMHNSGYNQQFLKLPEALKPVFGSGTGYLSESHGASLIQWVDSGARVDEGLERVKSEMQMACSGGVKGLQDAWLKMPEQYKATMKPLYPSYEASAKAYDEQAAITGGAEEVKPTISTTGSFEMEQSKPVEQVQKAESDFDKKAAIQWLVQAKKAVHSSLIEGAKELIPQGDDLTECCELINALEKEVTEATKLVDSKESAEKAKALIDAMKVKGEEAIKVSSGGVF